MYCIKSHAFLTLCEVSYIPDSVWSKIVYSTVFLACIYDHKGIPRKYNIDDVNSDDCYSIHRPN